MGDFVLCEKVDKNKVFLIKKSDLETRLDPYYYQPKFVDLEKKLQNIKFTLSNLKTESCKIFSGMTPLSGGDSYVENGGVYFLRSGDYLEDNSIDFSKVIQIKFDVHNGSMKNSKLQKGDVLIAIVGATIGKIGVYLYDEEANINQAICAVRLKGINPLFIQYFYQTKIGQQLLDRIKRPVARANINLDEIGQLPIPLVDKVFEQNFINIMDTAYSLRKQKYEEAQRLIKSIDSYLLNELGITLPKTHYDGIKDRMFLVKHSDVVGKRMDPKYSIKFKNLFSNTKYHFVSLKDVLLDNTSGQYGANEEAIDWDENKTRYIRITDIDELGNLKNSDKKSANYIDQKYLLRYNDFLFARSGSVGKSYIHKNISEPAIFAGYLIRFNLNNDIIDSDYLFYYCNSKLYWMWVDAIQRPAVQANINSEEYRSLLIPLPPLNKQQEIVNRISLIRQQAKDLELEGEKILEEAKKEIEKMILG